MKSSKRAKRLKGAARTIARRCRHIVQACLREEEWVLADQEFYVVALKVLQHLERENPNEH
jgi:hypothetical protein